VNPKVTRDAQIYPQGHHSSSSAAATAGRQTARHMHIVNVPVRVYTARFGKQSADERQRVDRPVPHTVSGNDA